MNRRTVFFISDRTGITAETLGHSLITQFDNIKFTQITLPFVDTLEKAQQACNRISQATALDGAPAIIFGTIIQDDIRKMVADAGGMYIDFVHTFIGPLEKELGVASTHSVGRSHGVSNSKEYNMRIDSVNYSLTYDDGASTKGYDLADVILVGVSRSGKTPTCLYLAMQFGVRAANYPLIVDDLDTDDLPAILKPYKSKIVGITIEPVRLQSIRSKRRPDSRYAENSQCMSEVKMAERMFEKAGIPYVNSTTSSIEEMAARIMSMLNIERRLR